MKHSEKHGRMIPQDKSTLHWKGSFEGIELPRYFNHFGIVLFEELQ